MNSTDPTADYVSMDARTLEREADKLADLAAQTQRREGVTERVEQMYADARTFRTMAWSAQTDWTDAYVCVRHLTKHHPDGEGCTVCFIEADLAARGIEL